MSKFFSKLNHFLKLRSFFFIACVAFLSIILIGFLDEKTGEEISFSLFYLIPVVIGTWYGSRNLGLFISFWASIVWAYEEFVFGRDYSHVFILFWNSFVRLFFFFITAILLAEFKDKLEFMRRLASLDSLTGLANLRFFYEKLSEESEYSKRYQHALTLLYIDLDNFKKMNDTYGHKLGDDVLQLVAHTLKSSTRKTDFWARIGGDEFVGIFPETDYHSAETLLEKLRLNLLEQMQKKQWPITFSMGAITFQEEFPAEKKMLEISDHLMYLVKKNGKNSLLHQLWKTEILTNL